MSSIKKALMASSGGAGLDVDEVFSAHTYTGTSTARSITNGIDLSGEGGLVWTKGRSAATNHVLCDTEQGTGKYLVSNANWGATSNANVVTSFNSDGYSFGTEGDMNQNTASLASWTWRKAPKFFDVVTFTGTGSYLTEIPHNLGVAPGMIIIKRTNSTSDWGVWHRGNGTTDYTGLSLNATTSSSQQGPNSYQYFTDTYFRPTFVYDDTNTTMNVNGGTYVAYVFAHNDGDGGFGPDSDQDIIKCGSYTGNGSTTGPVIDLGWEPQFILWKNAAESGNNCDWFITDKTRGMSFGGITMPPDLYPNSSTSENALTGYSTSYLDVLPNGFQPKKTDQFVNKNNIKYVYMAIRCGPITPPESSSGFFKTYDLTGVSLYATVATDFVPDMVIHRHNLGGNNLLSKNQCSLQSNATANSSRRAWLQPASGAYQDDGTYSIYYKNTSESLSISNNYGGVTNQSSIKSYQWKRAAGFFDTVGFLGNGSSQAVKHNLNAVPEMMWVKNRSRDDQWLVYADVPLMGNTKITLLSSNSGAPVTNASWNNTTPTEDVFTVGNTTYVNPNGEKILAMLFASTPGVSKIGSVVHSGTTNVDCGFSSGSRFIMLKSLTVENTDWLMFDSVSGITTGNDKWWAMNTTASQRTNKDYIDPLNAGFTITSSLTAGTYLFYAIA